MGKKEAPSKEKRGYEETVKEEGVGVAISFPTSSGNTLTNASISLSHFIYVLDIPMAGAAEEKYAEQYPEYRRMRGAYWDIYIDGSHRA